MQAPLLSSLANGVLTLTMNRPESRNSLSLELSAALNEALRAAQTERAVRVVVLTGAGGAFCAGGDVKAMAAGRDQDLTLSERGARLRARAEAVRLLHEMSKPTVALLPGAAAGAGLALALACDFRLAVDTAKITCAFARVGLSGDFGISWLLTGMVGAARARELMMLSPVLTAREALALGLLNRVASADEYASVTEEFIGRLASGPPIAYGHIKRNLNLAREANFAASLDSESMNQAICMVSEDHREAARAFAEKREPSFEGR
jgi:2-(1,2-epoxy-1,2-dihydrophenyl)acetyl-CoA isomerase